MRGKKAKAIRRSLDKDETERTYGQINVQDKTYKKWLGGNDEYENIPYQTRTIILQPESGRKQYRMLKRVYKGELEVLSNA